MNGKDVLRIFFCQIIKACGFKAGTYHSNPILEKQKHMIALFGLVKFKPVNTLCV